MSKILLLIITLGCCTGGCTSQPYVTPERLKNGLVIVLTGIEGRSVFNEAICEGIDQGGVSLAIELEDWTHPFPGAYLLSLRTEARNRRKAALIAERVVRYQMKYPGRPVVLVGQSGGGAIAVWVCEAMPWGRQVDGVIMLACALSPEYPLDLALGGTKRGIVNSYSEYDLVFLGAGTIVCGTMDGQHTSSAGRVGFVMPDDDDVRDGYKRLFQVAWSSNMGGSGNIGGHLTSGMPSFVSRYVAPLVLMEDWNSQSVAAIASPALTEVALQKETSETPSIADPTTQPLMQTKLAQMPQAEPTTQPAPATQPAASTQPDPNTQLDPTTQSELATQPVVIPQLDDVKSSENADEYRGTNWHF